MKLIYYVCFSMKTSLKVSTNDEIDQIEILNRSYMRLRKGSWGDQIQLPVVMDYHNLYKHSFVLEYDVDSPGNINIYIPIYLSIYI